MACTRTAILRMFGLGNAPPTLSVYRSSFQQRAFSATAAALRVTGPVPTFQPTSDPKLDSLLESLRQDYFFPVHVSRHDYRLMYRKQNHSRLIDDPITVDVEGQPFVLTPRTTSPGISHRKFVEALKLMKEPSDYDAIPELLRGFSEVNPGGLGAAKLEQMARHLNLAGRADILMQIARNAEKLHHFVFAAPVAREFMRALRNQQLGAERKKIATGALKHAAELLEIVGKREICVDKEKRLSDDNVILGTALSMFAGASLKYNNGEDFEGHTNKYVLKLKSVWTGPEMVELLDAKDARNPLKAKEYVYSARKLIREWTPVLEGILQAKSILAGSELSPWLEETSETLAGNIAFWGEFVERNYPVLQRDKAEKPLEE